MEDKKEQDKAYEGTAWIGQYAADFFLGDGAETKAIK
jgi:hypothetical protein